jgi:DNA helicase-2/ATP-dependent DNA helicase PcrA
LTLIICEDRQRILEAQGHVLVTGGPGSGKTTIALVKAKKRIDEGLSPGQTVLFLSFSRAAVARAMETSRVLIPGALQDRLSIETFHSFSWEIVRAYGYLLGAPRRLRLLPPHDESALRNGEREENAGWAVQREQLFRVEGRVVFDLFAPKAHDLVSQSTRIRQLFASRHPLIVVDEAQDTAEDQWQIAKLLAEESQLLCLADLGQQIYDFRPGVSAERLTDIMGALNPLRVNLKGQNHRSPGTEIIAFGNDILSGTARGSPYRGVSHHKYNPRPEHRDRKLRQSVGIVNSMVLKAAGARPQSIAFLATWGRGVEIIARALTGNGGEKLIEHRVMLDEAPILLSSRLVAFLMEPRGPGPELIDLADALDIAASVYRSKGGATNITQAERLTLSALRAREGKAPKKNGVGDHLLRTLRRLPAHAPTGDPARDWNGVRGILHGSGSRPLAEIAAAAGQLTTLQSGRRLAVALADLWQTEGSYAGACRALDAALAESQILSGRDDLRGIHVMTIHKSKGKEFDAVVILGDSNNSPLIARGEGAPYPRSRKLLRVGVTRARHHVFLLTDAVAPPALLDGHRL